MRTYIRVNNRENASITDSSLSIWQNAWKKLYISCVSVRVHSLLYIQSLWKVCFYLISDYSGKNRVGHQLISYRMRTYLRVNEGENAPITDSCLITWKKAWEKYTSHASQYVCILFYTFNLYEKYASSWFRIILVKTEYAISWFHTVWDFTQEWIMERNHRLSIFVYLLGKKHEKKIHFMCLGCHQLISNSMRTYLVVKNGENAPITDSCLFTSKKAWKNAHLMRLCTCVFSFIYSISLKSMLLLDFGLFL